MIRRPPRSTRTDTLFPYTTLFRSGVERHFDGATFAATWESGTRRLARLDVDLGARSTLALVPSGPVFAMSGLGYTHPVWGHGFDHGADPVVAHDALTEEERSWANPLAMHIQALVTAELADGDAMHRRRTEEHTAEI